MREFHVEELRSVAAETDDATSNRIKSLCTLAADEIERLRATIESLRQIAGAASIELPIKTFAEIRTDLRSPPPSNSTVSPVKITRRNSEIL